MQRHLRRCVLFVPTSWRDRTVRITDVRAARQGRLWQDAHGVVSRRLLMSTKCEFSDVTSEHQAEASEASDTSSADSGIHNRIHRRFEAPHESDNKRTVPLYLVRFQQYAKRETGELLFGEGYSLQVMNGDTWEDQLFTYHYLPHYLPTIYPLFTTHYLPPTIYPHYLPFEKTVNNCLKSDLECYKKLL